jgi:hypothetical protein
VGAPAQWEWELAGYIDFGGCTRLHPDTSFAWQCGHVFGDVQPRN